MWNSIERLGSLITLANWGIAATLLVAFACTVLAIKASSRKDELTGAEDLRKAEHIADLDHANLTLRGQVATLETNAANANRDLAGLQRAAADAKAAQQRVETDLAKQKEKTATAERSLLQLQRRVEPRRISPDQRARLMGLLSHGPKGKAAISCVLGDGEGTTLANDINEVLKASGWETSASGVSQGAYSGGNPVGLFVQIHDAAKVPPSAVLLQQAFFAIGMPLPGVVVPSVQDGTVEILVGNKPQ